MHFSISTWRHYDADGIWQCWECCIEQRWEKAQTIFNDSLKYPEPSHCTRSGSCRHNRQFVDIKDRHFLEIERRSALGLIWVYNRLPAEIVYCDTVKGFQTALQQLLIERLISGCDDSKGTYSPRIRAYAHPLR